MDRPGLEPAELGSQLFQTPEGDKGRDDGGNGSNHVGTCRRDGGFNAGRQGGMGGGSNTGTGDDDELAELAGLLDHGIDSENSAGLHSIAVDASQRWTATGCNHFLGG